MKAREPSRSNSSNDIGSKEDRGEQQRQANLERERLADSSLFFTEFIDQHKQRIFSVAVSILGSREEAEDVTQEGFLRAFAAVRQGEEIDDLRAWTSKVVTNLALDRWRKTVRHPVLSFHDLTSETEQDFQPVDTHKGPAELAAEKDIASFVWQQFMHLPPKYRAVLVLYAIEGLSHREVAKTLGTTTVNARVLYHRAKEALRRELVNGLDKRDYPLPDCRSVMAELPSYLAGKLTPARADEVRRHLQTCPSCSLTERSCRDALFGLGLLPLFALSSKALSKLQADLVSFSSTHPYSAQLHFSQPTKASSPSTIQERVIKVAKLHKALSIAAGTLLVAGVATGIYMGLSGGSSGGRSGGGGISSEIGRSGRLAHQMGVVYSSGSLTLSSSPEGHLTWQCPHSSRYPGYPQSITYFSGGYYRGRIPFLPRVLLPSGYSARIVNGRAGLYAPYLITITSRHGPPAGLGPTTEWVKDFEQGPLQAVQIPGPYPVEHSANWSTFTTTAVDADVFILPFPGSVSQEVTVAVQAPRSCGGTSKLVHLALPATSSRAHLLGVVSAPIPLPEVHSSVVAAYRANYPIFSAGFRGGPRLEQLSSATFAGKEAFLWWPSHPSGLVLSTTYTFLTATAGPVPVPAELPEPSILLYGR
ncbi:MAG: sigma-70 family RNA polymerase sigma factor [Actinobacteria bacterium]|nr:sigma-70 family RNA polymerase sigma factor [Actinomycetota bacterium]MCL6095490.1 sigma-70 family RNA polymerase sigma factor [Actinomycetota bacterium]